MAKRSPILGYNHNVLYRGLVFHVQTEDSGLMSPHLFTHLFHGGVIISTRKLVYDAGAAEDAIKGLMQSQHKIVLKDLKRGAFDDKIDQYLVGTEGLLPRTTPAGATPVESAPPSGDMPRASAPEIPVAQAAEEPPIAKARPGTEEIEQLDPIEPPMDLPPGERPSEPMIIIEDMGSPPAPAIARTATPPPVPRRPSTPIPVPRTQTAERKSAPTAVRSNLAPPPPPSMDEIDPPTDPDVDSGAIAAAINVNATVKTPMATLDSAPEISIKLDLEDEEPASARTRSKHDTDIQVPPEIEQRSPTLSDGVPQARGGGESIPPLPPPPDRRTGDRAPSVGAAALPPARPISRPPSRQAITPPAVMSRPIPNNEDSSAVEVYAPAPQSIDPPPGERAERPGQYAQHKKPAARSPVDAIKGDRDRTGSVPIPAGLSRPGTGRSSAVMPAVSPPSSGSGRTHPPSSPQPMSARTGTPSQPHSAQRSPSQQHQVPRTNTPSQPPATQPLPSQGRTPTPSRVSPPGSGPARSPGTQSGGVVMTRPAVIVGAPAKTTAPPRVRKAREEEGRGFGQGLISEKSLDEVILAYLSEDADDK